MIDIKRLIDKPEEYKNVLFRRGYDPSTVNNIISLDSQRRELITKVEALRNQKKIKSKDFGLLKKQGKDSSGIDSEIKKIDKDLSSSEDLLKVTESELEGKLMSLPNYLLDDVPQGVNETNNKVIREWGKKPDFSFNPRDHVDLGEKLDIIDLKRASKVTGARFVFMKGLGAKLERALINFMMDTHTTEHGYEEILSPFMVNEQSLLGTGQLPKFGEDLFKIENFPYYLIPTAEVPITNFVANEILSENDLPLKLVGFSTCFRSEAGSYGKDTRGIIRQHQFNKVELVKITNAKNSVEEHESLTKDAEKILQLLGLHYRVVSLCSGDIGFGAAKCYDIEVWLPSLGEYKEISSCSNYLDFQARRAKIRYKDKESGKNTVAHTINGSGLAIGRTVIALMEQYQGKDGSIEIPKAIRSYMGADIIR